MKRGSTCGVGGGEGRCPEVGLLADEGDAGRRPGRRSADTGRRGRPRREAVSAASVSGGRVQGASTIARSLKVAFLLQDLQLSGGVGVVVEHASQLAARHGFDVTLAMTRSRRSRTGASAGSTACTCSRSSGRARTATTSPWPPGGRPPRICSTWTPDRHAYFVQSLEDRFYGGWDPMRVGAALTHALPVHFITEARWIAETLEELQPGRARLLRPQRHRQGRLRPGASGAAPARGPAPRAGRGLPRAASSRGSTRRSRRWRR